MAKQIRLKGRVIIVKCCEECPIKDTVFLCGTDCKSGCYQGEDYTVSVCKNCPLKDYNDKAD